jgi:hypothetical protein
LQKAVQKIKIKWWGLFCCFWMKGREIMNYEFLTHNS